MHFNVHTFNNPRRRQVSSTSDKCP